MQQSLYVLCEKVQMYKVVQYCIDAGRSTLDLAVLGMIGSVVLACDD